MKPSLLLPALRKLIQAGEPVLVTGPPGGGKTTIAVAACNTIGYRHVLWHPVVADPTDYKGLPFAADRNGVVHAEFVPFGDLRLICEATEPLVVIIDDLGQATPATQAALMQVLYGGWINGHRISPHVRFVACTNRRQDQAAVTGLLTALLDRFTTVLALEFDITDWIRYGLDHGTPIVLLGFAKLREELFNVFEPTRDMRKQPTARSITGLGRLLNLGLDDLEVVSGAVGEGFATEFLAFYRTWQLLPDRDAIYLNPRTEVVPDRPDVLYALMGSLSHGATVANIDATVCYLDRCPAEFATVCMKAAVRDQPLLRQTAAYTRWTLNNRDVTFGD